MAWIAAGLFACLPASAAAQPPTSQVGLTGANASAITGQVTSPAAKCVGGRAIRVDSAGVPVTTVTSDATGAFSIAFASLPAGSASLTVTVLRPSPAGQRACKPDAAQLALDQGTLTGGVNGTAFGGRLSSSDPACVSQRTVEIYDVTSEPNFVGFNLTNAAGDWFLAAAGGTYEARAVATIRGGPEAFAVCRALTSPPWFYEDPV